MLLQFPCLLLARKRGWPQPLPEDVGVGSYFAFTKVDSEGYRLINIIVGGIGLFAIVAELLHGFSAGSSTAFSSVRGLIDSVLTIGLGCVFIALVLLRKQAVSTIGIFVAMEALACFALMAYAGLPEAPSVGSALADTLGALVMALSWYVIIALMSCGRRDPFFYAVVAWTFWLACRFLARVVTGLIPPTSDNPALMSAFIATFTILPTQAVIVKYLAIVLRSPGEEKAAGQPQVNVVARLMAIERNENMSKLREASMQHNAREMGRQFLLSEREIEVLALYALGHTQKRVAEELYITQGTVHGHIKRIYAKTGLHSRQEILDYLQRYTS